MKMHIEIRRYTQEDKEQVLEFITRLRFEVYGAPSPSILDIQNIPENYLIFLLAENEKNIVGTCGLLKTDFGGEIKRAYIEKEFRRRGLGRRLINQIFDYALTNEVQRIELFTYEFNASAISFFSQVGFKRTKTENGKVYFSWNAEEILRNSIC